MTAPQHRAQLAVRVERLEAAAFRLGIDLGDIKTAVEQLPTTIRQEILEYTEPVFGEIMAGNASLATKEDLDQLEHRLKDLVETRFAQMDDKLDRLLTALSQPSSN
jgi:DNA-binding transcriptional MerR regulator